MTDNAHLLPVVQKFFEYDLDTAAHILESMTEVERPAVTDVLGFLAFLGFAVMFQNALIA